MTTTTSRVKVRAVKPRSSRRLRRAPLVLFFFFALHFAAGITAGEPGRVLAQAVQICLSCIGIG